MTNIFILSNIKLKTEKIVLFLHLRIKCRTETILVDLRTVEIFPNLLVFLEQSFELRLCDCCNKIPTLSRFGKICSLEDYNIWNVYNTFLKSIIPSSLNRNMAMCWVLMSFGWNCNRRYDFLCNVSKFEFSYEKSTAFLEKFVQNTPFSPEFLSNIFGNLKIFLFHLSSINKLYFS